MRADELLRRLTRELRTLNKSGLDAVDLDLIKDWMDEAKEYLGMDPSLQKSIARFPWSVPSVPALVGLLTRVTGALDDRLRDEYPGGFAHGPRQQDDRGFFRYPVQVPQEGGSPHLFLVT
jgi:hypothetical protein